MFRPFGSGHKYTIDCHVRPLSIENCNSTPSSISSAVSQPRPKPEEPGAFGKYLKSKVISPPAVQSRIAEVIEGVLPPAVEDQ